MNPEIVPLESGWNTLRTQGIDRLEYFLDTGKVPEDAQAAAEPGKPIKIFGTNEYSNLYTYVFSI